MKKTHTDYLVGIDIGTSCCKAVLVDAAGRVLHTESRGYPLMQLRPGWTEQNPEQWWQGAAAACRALLDMGLQIPRDVSVIGYDGIELTAYCQPVLATIRQPQEALARESVSLLLRGMEQPGAHVLLDTELIPGASVRCLL